MPDACRRAARVGTFPAPRTEVAGIFVPFLLPIDPGCCRASRSGANPEEGGRALRTYELMMIAEPELDEDGLNAVTERVQQVIANNGGEIVKVEQMGRRKLAYPVERRREGHYVLIHANMERETISELERSLRLSEDVFRHLLVRLDEVLEAPEPQETPEEQEQQEQAPASETPEAS